MSSYHFLLQQSFRLDPWCGQVGPGGIDGDKKPDELGRPPLHGLIVQEGLPPHPGPVSDRSKGGDQEGWHDTPKRQCRHPPSVEGGSRGSRGGLNPIQDVPGEYHGCNDGTPPRSASP